MAMYQVRVQQTLERVVQVEAYSTPQAREMAERGEGGWIDGGRGTCIGIEALDVSREPEEEDASSEREVVSL